MFLHNFKYALKTGFRNKGMLIWLLIFPIALGTFFKAAFGEIYDKDMTFKSIPVAVVEENGENQIFRNVLDSVSEGDDALFKPVFADADSALEKLKAEDVSGIIYVNNTLSLTVATNGMKSTILEQFVDKYNISAEIISDTLKTNPAGLPAVTEKLSADVESVKSSAMSKGNTNTYDQYFYNLIAMVAMYGALAGLHIATENQGNLSALGARKCVSPTPKIKSMLAGTAATFVIQTLCMMVAVSFLHFVLKVDMGERLGFFYLTSIVGGMVGVSLGFAVGSISRANMSVKNTIVMSTAMLMCFFSGLMDAGIKQRIEHTFPLFNRINPAAVISEALFSLNIYEDYARYTRCMVTLVITIAVFTAIGFLFTRRRKYASL